MNVKMLSVLMEQAQEITEPLYLNPLSGELTCLHFVDVLNRTDEINLQIHRKNAVIMEGFVRGIRRYADEYLDLAKAISQHCSVNTSSDMIKRGSRRELEVAKLDPYSYNDLDKLRTLVSYPSLLMTWIPFPPHLKRLLTPDLKEFFILCSRKQLYVNYYNYYVIDPYLTFLGKPCLD